MGSRACSIDRLDVAHLVTRNSRHCCWPVPKKFINCKEAQEALQEEKFLWDIRQEAFRTTCRQLFFSPQNPNNKMRAKKPGTCNYHQLGVWSVCYVCTMLVCTYKKGKGMREEAKGVVPCATKWAKMLQLLRGFFCMLVSSWESIRFSREWAEID